MLIHRSLPDEITVTTSSTVYLQKVQDSAATDNHNTQILGVRGHAVNLVLT